jgi:hypothetical protein
MFVKHTLKWLVAAVALVAGVAAVWGSTTPVDRAGAASAPLERTGAQPDAPDASVVLLAQQDAWIDQSAPDTNHGPDPSLRVERFNDVQGAPFNRFTLVKFDLSPVPPNVSLISAQLQLYQIGASGVTSYTISPDLIQRSDWAEAVVTWNNQPASGNVGDSPVALDMSNGWKTWDVTKIVQGWLTNPNQTPNYGIMLTGDGRSVGMRLFGARNDPQTAPRLIIRFDRPRPAPTRTPLPTWTPIPSPTPTKGPAPTPIPIVPAYAYIQPAVNFGQVLNPIDLSIYGIEITQGIQCFDTSKGLASCSDNSLPVVAKKDSTARIYLKYTGSGTGRSNVPVRLVITAAGVDYIVNATGKAKPTLGQANADDAVNIWFNVNFSNDVPVSFYAIVDPNNAIAEANEGNNRYPAVGAITLNFRKRNTMTVVGQRLRYHPSGYGGTQYAAGWAVNGGGADWWEQVLPVRNNGINYIVANGYLDWTQSLGSGDGQHALISNLNLRWVIDNVFAWMYGGGAYTGARHVYGWAPSAGYSGGHADMPIYPHAGGYGVVGIGSDAAGTSTDNPGSGALIFGHELTHDYNIYHTNTADACGSNDGNSNFPYGSSSIQEFGFNPITGKVYNPALTHDLMSYCPAGGSKLGWISPFTWSRMFNNVAPAAFGALSATSVGVITPTQSSESLAVNVTISNPLNYGGQFTGALHDLYRVETGLVSPVIAGDYAIELRNGPTILASQTFTVNFESEYDGHGGPTGNGPNNDPPPFPSAPAAAIDASFVMPWQVGTTSIAVTYNGQVLDEKPVSPNSPVVTITTPTQIVTWTTSSNVLAWTGSDADGDPLHYAVFYSSNGGTNWSLLQEGLTGTSYNVDATALAGGSDTRFRVVATDGVNTGYAETPLPISVPDKSPYVLITNPISGTVVAPGDLLVLQGTATDMEDGGLPDDVFHWSSDKQGSLGIGPSLGLNVLTPGLHLITLSVHDGQGHISTEKVSVFIGYRVYLPLILR